MVNLTLHENKFQWPWLATGRAELMDDSRVLATAAWFALKEEADLDWVVHIVLITDRGLRKRMEGEVLEEVNRRETEIMKILNRLNPGQGQ